MSDVMCASRLQPRLVMAWTELARRRLVTSVMVMLVIISHRVHGVIMMMVMRQANFGTWVPNKASLRSLITSDSVQR
jgi:hypothetical protein